MGGRALIVAIDGPAGAGKSSTARRLAGKLGFLYLDSGSLYRAVAWKAKDSRLDPGDSGGIGRLCEGMKLDLVMTGGAPRILVDGTDISDRIRTPEISRAASVVAENPAVRRFLLKVQREIGRRAADGKQSPAGIVAEGRDIGTVVFPRADAKFFLDAAPEIRVTRRNSELRSRGLAVDVQSTREEIDQRDRRDTKRDVAPLAPAADAVRIDSSTLDMDGVIKEMTRVLQEKGLIPSGSSGRDAAG